MSVDMVAASASDLRQRFALLAATLSDGGRDDARLVTGEHRAFGLNSGRTAVHVPHPPLAADWSTRTMTCGIALQAAPSKDRVAAVPLDDLTSRELLALSVVEGRVALGWIAARWGGLLPELERALGGIKTADPDLDGREMLTEALRLARSGEAVAVHPLLGRLPASTERGRRLASSLRRGHGRMPWSSRRSDQRRIHSIPVGGEGGAQNPNLPPPSQPENEEIEIRPDERVGIPYPEWNMWTKRFLPNHVAVLERPAAAEAAHATVVSPALRRWFQEDTHRTMRNGLEDGADLDITRYVDHFASAAAGQASEPRMFRDLVPGLRDVTTALLLDGSSSLGAHHGTIFEIELACADALSQAMTSARERHGVFTFTGNTRHRVDVRCLKDFDQPCFVAPSRLGLMTGGYTRLGAPIRHLTSRLLGQASERRLLIVIGDGLMCDEGYEGRYAWADVAHAVDEAYQAGVVLYYIGVGSTRVDPLPEVFGPRRSQRIRSVEELPRVLAHVHRELVAA
ncbi:MorD protein [Parafrankia colletiae]|uniref:MorD protein n=1 Tax=Parafrankia colletiae TaxID=573497 RepID=A0A1S1R8A8_9ACTN|nr:VWA domain-containing protein [Parafrankia colletiae]MCK9905002.1 VWA domain-containing protein [Frankia sp. Cpl3]OHV41989.1 MorD protein [Parafrankia colletiae]